MGREEKECLFPLKKGYYDAGRSVPYDLLAVVIRVCVCACAFVHLCVYPRCSGEV